MKKKALIIVAQPEELIWEKLSVNFKDFHSFALITGIGPVAAGVALTHFLDKTPTLPDYVINAGFCGTTSPELKIGDIVQVSTASYIFDPFGVDPKDYTHGLTVSGLKLHSAHCYTGYEFFEGGQIKSTSEAGKLSMYRVFDMETAVLAQLMSANLPTIPFYSLKIVSDNANLNQYDNASVETLAESLTKKVNELIAECIKL